MKGSQAMLFIKNMVATYRPFQYSGETGQEGLWSYLPQLRACRLEENNAESKEATFKRIKAYIENAEKTIEKFSIHHISIDYSDYKKRLAKALKDINSLLDLDLLIEDLNYQKCYDHSSLIGSFTTSLDGYTKILSPKSRRRLKMITPYSLLGLLSPER
jgi:hypothetical protein